ncbi:MAG: glycosyltransferase [Kiritimatiellia bacterium]
MAEPVYGIAVLIPVYNPDRKLLALLPKLRVRFTRIVLVDDGSTEGREIFPQAAPLVEKILVHEKNRGKGAALKTGFAYLDDGRTDVITADADGQHTPEDIGRIADALGTHRHGLVLGVRSFCGKVPFRSRFGNWWTCWIFFLMTGGLFIRDTQTGLRGIPAGLLPRIRTIPGSRYEYEMAMLADAKHHEARPKQVPIATVYIEGNATSHFNPLLDTIRVYRRLLQFCLSSVLSFLIDNGLFAYIVWFLSARDTPRHDNILIALAVARTVSSHFNYFYNRFIVFRRLRVANARHRSYYGYFGLVLLVGLLSYALTEGCSALLDVKGVAITIVKVVVDVALFFISYWVQKKFVFRQSESRGG